MNKLTVAFLFSHPVHFLALGFGTGLAPKAPGTVGTLAALPFILCMPYFSTVQLIAIIAFMSVVGIYICGKTAQDAGVHDHGGIVWDEIVGYFITMLLSPITIPSLITGFLLFRLFDIFKPWPISFIDKNCTGGFGIMFDDIVAGIAAFAVMQFIF